MSKIMIKNLRTNKYYRSIIVEDLLLKQQYKTIMAIPTIKKIVVNTSSKQIIYDKKFLLPSLYGIELISNQKGTITRAKKSIATFKIRKNQIIGAKVTLRNHRMFSFFEKILIIILPRLVDYQGTSQTSLDRKGNINIGINNVLIFPELESYFQFFENMGGLDISIETSTHNNQEGFLFLSSFQLPTTSFLKSF